MTEQQHADTFLTECDYCNALWERNGNMHRHPMGKTFIYPCAGEIAECVKELRVLLSRIQPGAPDNSTLDHNVQFNSLASTNGPAAAKEQKP